MRRVNQKPIDTKTFSCPQCGKLCMSRPLTHKVNKETTEFKARDGSSVSLLTDTCDACVARNYKLYFEPTKSDVKKVLGAMTNQTPISLEELL